MEKIIPTIVFLLQEIKKTIKYEYITPTQLYKYLFYIDFLHYKLYSKSITNSYYFKLPYGPVPLEIKGIIDIVKDNLELEEKKFENLKKSFEENFYFNHNKDKEQTEIKLKENITNIELEKAETETILSVIKSLKDYDLKKIIELSHDEDGYKIASFYDIIPYEYAGSLKYV